MMEKIFVQGAHYNVEMKDSSKHVGVFVFENKDFLFLKLESGYNIGISKKNITSCEEIKNSNFDKFKKEQDFEQSIGFEQSNNTTSNNTTNNNVAVENNKENNPEIIILHTGGTIASKVDYSTGAVNAKFTPTEMIQLFPEIKSLAKIDSVLISNMSSDNINFNHYNKMAKAIEESLRINTIKGIILTHGTDTLHYTASALSFMFESLPIPVVLVGSQRSSDRPSSDAAINILNAAYFIMEAKNHKLNGVFICMHESIDDNYCTILPAQNVKKLHSSRRDAFKSINRGPLARVNFEKKKIEILTKNYLQNTCVEKHFESKPLKHLENITEEKLKENIKSDFQNISKNLRLFNPEIKVGIIRSRPGLHSDELKIYEKFDGLILEGTGLGHFPIEKFDEFTENNLEILKKIEKIASKKVACITSQTTFGRINLNVYSPGRTLKDAGVLGHNLDMITETAYIKLVWLLSNYSKKETKELYSQNLRGEISNRSEKEEFL